MWFPHIFMLPLWAVHPMFGHGARLDAGERELLAWRVGQIMGIAHKVHSTAPVANDGRRNPHLRALRANRNAGSRGPLAWSRYLGPKSHQQPPRRLRGRKIKTPINRRGKSSSPLDACRDTKRGTTAAAWRQSIRTDAPLPRSVFIESTTDTPPIRSKMRHGSRTAR